MTGIDLLFQLFALLLGLSIAEMLVGLGRSLRIRTGATKALYFPGLVALWYVKSPRANIALLIFMIALLVIAALGAEL